jgi:hypothetical protein
MGRAVTAQAVAPQQALKGLPAIATHGGERAGDDIVYQPETALAALWTEGHTNIAITSPAAWKDELSTLGKYSLVVKVPGKSTPANLATFIEKVKRKPMGLATLNALKEAKRG